MNNFNNDTLFWLNYELGKQRSSNNNNTSTISETAANIILLAFVITIGIIAFK